MFYLNNPNTRYLVQNKHSIMPHISRHGKLLLMVFFLTFVNLFSAEIYAQQKYQATIHLSSQMQQPLEIELLTPTPTSDFATFVLPLNTHPIYGKQVLTDIVHNFAAFDQNNQQLPHELISNNGILIRHARQLKKIRYNVRTNPFSCLSTPPLDEKNSTSSPTLPAYLLTREFFFGYLQEYLNYPYQVRLYKPTNLSGSTSLPIISVNDSTDIISLDNYQALLDNPMLYAPPDTFSFMTDGVLYHIAVCSATRQVRARQLYYILEPAVRAVNLLIPNVPIATKDYWFLCVFDGPKTNNTAFDAPKLGGTCGMASSLYRLPETTSAHELYSRLQPMAAHELLHRLSPFALHSNKVHYNGLDKEGMGQHLWLYEGVTEYLTWLALLRSNLIEEEKFWHEMGQKATIDEQFSFMSLTESSQKIFKARYAAQYPNFYARAPLAAFLLDVLWQQEAATTTTNTGAEKKTEQPQNLLQMLDYLQQHVARPFDDDSLFIILKQICPPRVYEFIDNCLIGKKKLPYNEIVGYIGRTYYAEHTQKKASFGQFSLIPDYKKEQINIGRVGKTSPLFRQGDLLKTIQAKSVTTGNINDFLPLLYDPIPEQTLDISIVRHGKEISFHALPQTYYTNEHNLFVLSKNITAQQKQLLKRVFYDK